MLLSNFISLIHRDIVSPQPTGQWWLSLAFCGAPDCEMKCMHYILIICHKNVIKDVIVLSEKYLTMS